VGAREPLARSLPSPKDNGAGSGRAGSRGHSGRRRPPPRRPGEPAALPSAPPRRIHHAIAIAHTRHPDPATDPCPGDSTAGQDARQGRRSHTEPQRDAGAGPPAGGRPTGEEPQAGETNRTSRTVQWRTLTHRAQAEGLRTMRRQPSAWLPECTWQHGAATRWESVRAGTQRGLCHQCGGPPAGPGATQQSRPGVWPLSAGSQRPRPVCNDRARHHAVAGLSATRPLCQRLPEGRPDMPMTTQVPRAR
jgi:hypothetical protein